MKTKEVVCVTGASGCIGQALLALLLKNGYQVKALFRKEDESTNYWKKQGCEIILGDLANQTALHTLTKNATKVFHVAAIMSKGNYALSHQINVTGSTALYKAAAANRCNVFIFVSSISVYCATNAKDNIFTEEILPENVHKLNAYSRTKLEMEQSLQNLYTYYKLPYIIIRPTNVYGPRSEPWIKRVFKLFKKMPLAFGNVAIDIVYVDDVAWALLEAAKTKSAYNQIFNIGNEMIILSEYIKKICSLVGISTYTFPSLLDNVIRLVIDKIQPIISGEIPSFLFFTARNYPYTKATKYFHYHPKVSFKEGLNKTAQWLRSSHR